MAEYIERDAAYKDFEKCNSENPKWTPSRVKTLIARQKAADVAPVMPELRKAVKELHKQYERAINSPAVRNPLAWALYRTWKQMYGDDDKV